MKFIKILFLFVLLTFIYSCGRDKESKMKKDFKETYSEIMKDPDSYELVSFEIFQESAKFTEKNEWFMLNFESLSGHENDDFSEVYDSLSKIETQNNPKWIYTGALVRIKGTNSYGAKVTSKHIAYYLMDTLYEIDGDRVI